jgi:circadian clock protein KaiC
VEIDSQLRKVMAVIKMRGGNHSKDIREYVITDNGGVLQREHLLRPVPHAAGRLRCGARRHGPQGG